MTIELFHRYAKKNRFDIKAKVCYTTVVKYKLEVAT